MGSCSTFRGRPVCDTLSRMPSRPRMRPVFEIPIDDADGGAVPGALDTLMRAHPNARVNRTVREYGSELTRA